MLASHKIPLDAKTNVAEMNCKILVPLLKDDRLIYYKDNGIALDPSITFSPSIDLSIN